MANAGSGQDKTITLNAACHCRGYSASYTLPVSAFPLKSAVCNCTSCRHYSAQLFVSYAIIPSDKLPSGGTIKEYQFSPNLRAHFCRVCGTTIANIEPTEWEFATGILSVKQEADAAGGDERREGKGNGIEGLLNRQCLFVSDTEDGGGIVWFPKLNSAGLEMKRHVGHRTSANVDEIAMQKEFAEKHANDKEEERLHGGCHCGTVKFFITRPDPSDPAVGDNTKGGDKWWLAHPKDSGCRKYKAQLDACDSCRLITGFEVNAWIYVPNVNVFAKFDGEDPVRFDVHDPRLNLGQYESSPGGNWRTFCQTCGATVCYWGERREVPVLDFGIGIFYGKGARCDDWVDWKGVEFAEDAMDKKFVYDIMEKAGVGFN